MGLDNAYSPLLIQPTGKIGNKVMRRAAKPDRHRKRGLMIEIIAGGPTPLFIKLEVGHDYVKNTPRAKDA
jgi:hypothetical protein